MMKKIIQTSIVMLIVYTMLYAGLAAAHGKVTLEQDSCVRGVDGSKIHLAAYQPQYDPTAEYCTEIPEVGNTFWVIDLVDQALRNMPIGIRVVRGNGEAQNETETVAYLRSTTHQDGVIKGEANLEEGLYTVLITGEGIPPVHYEYPLRVQMINYTETFSAAAGPAIVLILFAWLTTQYLKRRRIQH